MEPIIKYSHYKKDISKYKILDIYRLLKLYNVTDQALGHAVKKLLCPGGRGQKSTKQDIIEARDTLNRWIELDDEDLQVEREKSREVR
jgi:hypothetical protein